MHAVVFAGGKGTRLQPYTSETPKALVPVGGRPIVEILIKQLVRCGVTKAHLALGHRAGQIREVIADGSHLGVEIAYYEESKPLSTVGPLKLIQGLPGNFLAVNGDILTDLDFSDLYAQHQKANPVVTVVTCRRENIVDYGVLELDESGAITGFREKPRSEYIVSAGIYAYSKRILDLIPPDQAYGFDQLMRDLLNSGEAIGRYQFDGYWLDIGRPDDYERANVEIQSKPHLLS